MELASSGQTKISEEYGACSPSMAHYPALIWVISLSLSLFFFLHQDLEGAV